MGSCHLHNVVSETSSAYVVSKLGGREVKTPAL